MDSPHPPLHASIVEWVEDSPHGRHRTGPPYEITCAVGLVIGWQPIPDPDYDAPREYEPLILRGIDPEPGDEAPRYYPTAEVIPARHRDGDDLYRAAVKLFSDGWQHAWHYANAHADHLAKNAAGASDTPSDTPSPAHTVGHPSDPSDT